MKNPLALFARMLANWRAARRIRRENEAIAAGIQAVRDQAKLRAGLRNEAAVHGPHAQPLTDIRRLAPEAHAEHGNLTMRQRKALAEYDRDAAAAVRERNGQRLHTVKGGR